MDYIYLFTDKSGLWFKQAMGSGFLLAPLPEGLKTQGENYETTEADIAAAVQWLSAPKPPSIPASVSRAQMQYWLIENNYDAKGAIFMMGLEPKEEAKLLIMWAELPDFHRNNKVLLEVAEAMGMTSADIDRAFIESSQLFNENEYETK